MRVLQENVCFSPCITFDMQNIQSYSVKGLQVAGFYNGLYCRSDVRNHIEWLNGISPVQMLDITK